MIKKWQQLDEKLMEHTSFFDLYSRRMRSPRGQYEGDFYVFTTVDWINIIPLTANNEVLLVEQFRHGIRENCLEIPGGKLDDFAEDPQAAACRELQEETGYSSTHIEYLGHVHPNPALQSNSLHSYVAFDCLPNGPQALDPGEDIELHLVPLATIPTLISSGQITHSLAICAFFLFWAKFAISLPLTPPRGAQAKS